MTMPPDCHSLIHPFLLLSLCPLSPENFQNYLWFLKSFPLVYIDWRKDQGPVREPFDLSLCDDSTVIPSQAQNSVHACANLCQLMSNPVLLLFSSSVLSLSVFPTVSALFFFSLSSPTRLRWAPPRWLSVYYTVSTT